MSWQPEVFFKESLAMKTCRESHIRVGMSEWFSAGIFPTMSRVMNRSSHTGWNVEITME